jgi:LysM repeat protein
MENNESNLKPQPTGGLKLMTVFVAVLALHVLVIGGFTAYYYLVKPAVGDDVALDKNHKGTKTASDTTLPGDIATADTTAAIDKPATSTPAPANTDVSTTEATTPAATDTASLPATTPSAASSAVITPTPAPAPLEVTPPPSDAALASSSSPTTTTSNSGQHGPVINPPDALAPPADNTLSASAAPADSSAPVADGTPYTVKKGDSLARIARRHHVALAQLKLANSLSNDRLHIGQKLVIPNRAEKLAGTTTTPPDASALASTPQLTSADSSAPTTESTTDSTTEPAVATTSVGAKPMHTHKLTSSGGRHLYTVVKGDTLSKIARRYHTTASAIMAANNITNASRLSIGKKLHIPSGEARSAADSAPVAAPVEPENKSTTHGQLANYVPAN